MTIQSPSHNLGAALAHLKLRWGWLVGLGVILVITGLVALLSVVAATIVSVLWVGIMMIVAGVVEIVHGFRMKAFGRSLLWVVIGALYILGGVFAVTYPLIASTVLTLILGVALLIAGCIRVILGWHLKAGQHGGLVIFSGIVTALFGLVILIHWPVSSLFALGIILGIDLIQAGMSWINLGFFLKRRAH
ncbi:MAG TPA: HdeD family acid-resistance protein [Dongiaceae bacterium]|jgi:uncharacterized membrane protein HdeD (DUF308 family)